MPVPFQMTHMSSRQRDSMYIKVAYKEILIPDMFPHKTIRNLGHFCRGCGVPVGKNRGTINPDTGKEYPQGVIDCIDNSGNHRYLKNLQLLCRSCNMIKNPRREHISTNLEMSYSQKKNLKIEPLFRAYVINKLADNGGQYSEDRLVKGGAEKYGFSKKTAGDYMDKLTSDEGPLFLSGENVCWDETIPIEEWMEKHHDEMISASKEFAFRTLQEL